MGRLLFRVATSNGLTVNVLRAQQEVFSDVGRRKIGTWSQALDEAIFLMRSRGSILSKSQRGTIPKKTGVEW